MGRGVNVIGGPLQYKIVNIFSYVFLSILKFLIV